MKKYYVRYQEKRDFATINHGKFCQASSAKEALEVFKGIPGFANRKPMEVFVVKKNGLWQRVRVKGL